MMRPSYRCGMWSSLLLALLLLDQAQAARDTDVPGFLHGEVGVGYQGITESSRLYENAVEVGKMSEGESGTRFDLRFGFVPGMELFGTFPIVSNGYRRYKETSMMEPCYYGDDPEMVQSGPNCSVGSMIYLDAEDREYIANPKAGASPEYSWAGTDDLVFGLRWSPFYEADLGSFETLRRPLNRPFPPLATWRLELGVVVNTGSNFYEEGPGVGATGVVLGTSFSKRVGVSDPYFSFRHTRYGTYRTDIVDGTGQTIDYEIDPSNETDILFGVELVPFTDKRRGSKFVVDFAFGGYLRSRSDVVSGTLLPSVIAVSYDEQGQEVSPGTKDALVSEESQTSFQGRIRLQYQLFRYLRVDALLRLQYVLPHRLESPYRVVEGFNVRALYGVQVTSTF